MHGAWQAMHAAAQEANCPMISAHAGSSQRPHLAGVLGNRVHHVWCSLAEACPRLARACGPSRMK